MTIYAIGDVRGQCQALKQLLDQIEFNEAQDTLHRQGPPGERGGCPGWSDGKGS